MPLVGQSVNCSGCGRWIAAADLKEACSAWINLRCVTYNSHAFVAVIEVAQRVFHGGKVGGLTHDCDAWPLGTERELG